MKNRLLIELILGVFMVAFPGAEALAKDADKTESRLNAETFRGLALRNIGPALKSGRITGPLRLFAPTASRRAGRTR